MEIREKLKREATATAKFRGHKLNWKEPFRYQSGRLLQDAKCQVCGAWVQVDTFPPPNGIDIAGDALVLHCPAPNRKLRKGEEK